MVVGQGRLRASEVRIGRIFSWCGGTACSGCLKPEAGGVSTRQRRPWRFCPRAEEVDFEIRNEGIRIDTMRASGAGGQHVNTNDRRCASPISIRHRRHAGGEVAAFRTAAAACRSCAPVSTTWSANKAADERVGSAPASGSARATGPNVSAPTISHRGRVTDHRINPFWGGTLYKLDRVIEGDLDEVVDALISDYHSQPDRRHGRRWLEGDAPADDVAALLRFRTAEALAGQVSTRRRWKRGF